jgi:cell division protein FtsZ
MMSNSEFGSISFTKKTNQIIKVIGVAGGNATTYIYKGIKGVDFIVCNTDSQALQSSSVPKKNTVGRELN